MNLNKPSSRFVLLDGKTVNPVPVFGEYTWTRILSNSNTIGIRVKTNVSKELPYRFVNVTVVLGSEQKSLVVVPSSIENEFVFDTIHFESNNYTLMIMFSASDGFQDGKGTAINTYNETIEIIKPPAPSMANKHFASSFLFVVFSLIFILFIVNR